MSEENPFASENPFLQLKTKQFKANGSQGKTKKNAPPKPSRQRPDTSFAEAVDPTVEPALDHKELHAFYTAISGVTPLGTPEKKSKKARTSRTPALDNPVLQPVMHPSVSKQDASKATDSQSARNNAVPASSLQSAMTQEEPEGLNAFAQAMKDVAPLAGKGREILPEVPRPPVPLVEEDNPLQDFMEGKLEFSLAYTDEYVEGHIVGLDLMTVGKLQAGQFSPEAHIDLHGLNTQQAFEALVGFFRAAYLKGQRTVLVVSGRGLNSPQGLPVLREKLQDWLTQEPFRRVVLAFCTAKSSDGGAGALYVMLRKLRKSNGKVYWERKPADPDLV